LPGVLSAGTTTNIPLEREIAYDAVFSIDGRPPAESKRCPNHIARLVSPDYLKTLGVTLIKGRLIDQTDQAGQPPVVVISEELARQGWPEKSARKTNQADPPGSGFPVDDGKSGVVKNVKEDFANYPSIVLCVCAVCAVGNNFPVNLVVRTSSDPAGVITAVRQAIHAVDPGQPISNVMTMNENLARVLVTERFSAILMGVLAGPACCWLRWDCMVVMAYSGLAANNRDRSSRCTGARRIHVLQLISAKVQS